jgi:hypothetical protein
MNLDDSLHDKQTINGVFPETAGLAQAFKMLMRRGKNWEPLHPESKEALELIASHLARILHGDALEPKHWNDIASLARLRGKELETLESSIQRTARVRSQIQNLTLVEREPEDTE